MTPLRTPASHPFQYSLAKLHRPIIDVDQMHKEGGREGQFASFVLDAAAE